MLYRVFPFRRPLIGLTKARAFQSIVCSVLCKGLALRDRVQHTKLIEILQHIGLDDKDIAVLRTLYWNQYATVKIDGDQETDEIPIRRGVRQGCVLSPCLFNIYSEVIFKKAIREEKGVRIGGESITNIRYADDTAILAESIEDLQRMLDKVNEQSTQMGLTINIKKTKLLVTSKLDVGPINLQLNGVNISQVDHFKYLGSWINKDLDPDEEIKYRIQLARNSFLKCRTILSNKHLKLSTRVKFLKCYVWSVLMYGCETWILKTATMNRIEAFELWCYRRILKIPWTQRKTNEQVLNIMNKERELLMSIKQRKLEYLGHVMRGPRYELLRLILNGKIEGKKWIGRKKMSWLRNLRQWTGLTAEQLLHAARDRNRYKEIINMGVVNV